MPLGHPPEWLVKVLPRHKSYKRVGCFQGGGGRWGSGGGGAILVSWEKFMLNFKHKQNWQRLRSLVEIFCRKSVAKIISKKISLRFRKNNDMPDTLFICAQRNFSIFLKNTIGAKLRLKKETLLTHGIRKWESNLLSIILIRRWRSVIGF